MTSMTCASRVTFEERISIASYALIQRTESLLSGVVAVLALWVRRYKGRRELLQLSEHTLADTGLDRAMILAESGKPFWRA